MIVACRSKWVIESFWHQRRFSGCLMCHNKIKCRSSWNYCAIRSFRLRKWVTIFHLNGGRCKVPIENGRNSVHCTYNRRCVPIDHLVGVCILLCQQLQLLVLLNVYYLPFNLTYSRWADLARNVHRWVTHTHALITSNWHFCSSLNIATGECAKKYHFVNSFHCKKGNLFAGNSRHMKMFRHSAQPKR